MSNEKSSRLLLSLYLMTGSVLIVQNTTKRPIHKICALYLGKSSALIPLHRTSLNVLDSNHQ